MSGFHDVRLPLEISLGASGGPQRLTDVVRLASGKERRNARWSRSLRRWDLGGSVVTADQAHALIAFFEARGGRLNAFRMRDPIDWKSCAPSREPAAEDQLLGLGDGETQTFQLVKRYGESSPRPARRIIAGSVKISIAGIESVAFELDAPSGRITFATPPTEGAEIRAGFEFDTTVRFDADELEFSVVGADAVRIGRVPLMEVVEAP